MIGQSPTPAQPEPDPETRDEVSPVADSKAAAVEHGGRDGPEPTRYGDWEKNGRCIDF
ncbi:MAG: DUF1674 domain-containing protein [Xanthomonadales bacterium]|nr:DUF1674 domain-containing protein [Xanthomonadales bacterium]